MTTRHALDGRFKVSSPDNFFKPDSPESEAAESIYDSYLSNIEYMAQAGLVTSQYREHPEMFGDSRWQAVQNDYRNNLGRKIVPGETLSYEPSEIWSALIDASIRNSLRDLLDDPDYNSRYSVQLDDMVGEYMDKIDSSAALASVAFEAMIPQAFVDRPEDVKQEVFSRYQTAAAHSAVVRFVSARTAFFTDCVRYLASVSPEVIPGQTGLQWGEITTMDDFDSVVEYVANKYIEETGWRGGIKQQSKFFKGIRKADFHIYNETEKYC